MFASAKPRRCNHGGKFPFYLQVSLPEGDPVAFNPGEGHTELGGARCLCVAACASSVSLDRPYTPPADSAVATKSRDEENVPESTTKTIAEQVFRVHMLLCCERGSSSRKSHHLHWRNCYDFQKCIIDHSPVSQHLPLKTRNAHKISHRFQHDPHSSTLCVSSVMILPSGVSFKGALNSGGYTRNAPNSGRDFARDRSGST